MLNYKYFIIAVLIVLSCEEPTHSDNESFTIHLLKPSHGQTIESYPISIIAKVVNPNVINFVDFFIDDELWCSTASSDTIRLSYQPGDVSLETDLEIKAQGYNEFMEFSDSVTFSHASYEVSFFQDFTLSFLQNNSFQFMKFPVTNQLYSKYLYMALSDSLITYNDSTQSITGYFPGTEYVSPGVYDFYIVEKGHISIDNEIIQIESTPGDNDCNGECPDYGLHPVTGVTWIGAMSFANYFGWRIPSMDEWNEISAGINSVETNPNMANFANNFATYTTPVGYFNGTNKGPIRCTEDFNINGAYDLIGNVWEFTSSYSEVSSENILVCGGDYTSQFNSTIILSEFTSSIPYDIASKNFGFRCIADINYSAQSNNWTGPVSGVDEDVCGVCDGPGFDDDGCCSDYDQPNYNGASDCTSTCGGSAVEDECGICNGNGENCYDCAGILQGDEEFGAFIDACGECNNYSDTDGQQPDFPYGTCDCGGTPDGDAVVTECGCIGDDTGYEADWCYGCTDWQASNFMCDLHENAAEEDKCCIDDSENDDNRCKIQDINHPEENCNLSDCEIEYVIGTDGDPICSDTDIDGEELCFETGFIDYQKIIDDDSCVQLGCTDTNACNYDEDATEDDNSCTYDGVELILEFSSDNTVEVFYTSTDEIAGFQFGLQGLTITNANGGAAESAGFTMSVTSEMVLGFSLTGTTITPGSGILTILSFTGESNTACLNCDGLCTNIENPGYPIMSGLNGVNLDICIGSDLCE